MSAPLSVLNEEPLILRGPQLFHELIDWTLHSHSCALEYQAGDASRHTYTYQELRGCVQSLKANILDASDRRPLPHPKQQVIPILLPQSPALYIAILAILDAGAAYCPINLDSPSERIQFVAGDVSAKIVITTKDFRDAVSWKEGPKVIVIDEIPGPVGLSELPIYTAPTVKPSDLAYVMYTSGSTGKPKGVALPHLAVTQSLLAHDKHIPQFKRFLQFAAPSFDVSQFEIFFPLFRGATLVACHRPRLLNDLPGIINELEVDAAELTPTVAGSLLQRRKHVPGLRTLLTIGEMLTRPVVDEFGGSDTRESMLFGMYGPTEAAIHCTVNPRMKAGSKVSNIGIPFDTVSTFIIAIDGQADSQNARREPQILPVNEIGELVLGGPQLADGYLNRPEQNAAAFIKIKGRSAYRTGDKARMLEDGSLEILGRISSGQVKIRGQRAELGEIEEAVYKDENIKTAVACVIDGLLIVFVLERKPGTDVRQVMKTCSRWLPKYMLPNEIELRHDLPYLPSGKVDKKQLEGEFRQKLQAGFEEDENTQTEVETKVGSLLRDSCGIEVRANDRLAAHGLDSLLAIRIAALLRAAGHELVPLDVLQAETLKDLAVMCEHRAKPYTNGVKEPLASEELTKRVRELLSSEKVSQMDKIFPASALQDAMLTQTEVNGLAYNNEIELQANHTSDVKSVAKAIRALAEVNPLLRTGFIHCLNEDSSFVQVTWNRLSEDQVRIIEEFKESNKQVSKLSPLRPFEVELKGERDFVRIYIRIHHALYDGWSLELLLDDLQSIFCSESPMSRPPFQRVVQAGITSKQRGDSSNSATYWKDHLAQLDTQALPNFNTVTDLPSELRFLSRHTAVSTDRLISFANEQLSSPQAVFQAAFAIILASYLGTHDVAFGTVFSGRTAAIDGIAEIAGPCLSTLPVRIDLNTVATGSELVHYLHETNRKHLQHSSYSLRDIKKAAHIDPGRSVFDTLLVWQQTLHGAEHQREHVSFIGSRDYLEFAMTLEITPTKENICLKANYDVAVVPEKQVQYLLHQLEQLVLNLLESADQSIQHMKSSIEDAYLSIDNPSPQTATFAPSIFSTIEATAASQPNKLAVEFASTIETKGATTETLTYEELNSQANQIAHHLIASDSKADGLVLICLEKSLMLYTSILAVVKSGAGYLPVTPDTPDDRIRHIVLEANVKIVVTHSDLAEKFHRFEHLKVVFVDKLKVDDYPGKNPGLIFRPEDIGYCIFTSGSTGKPKGVLVTQGNLLSNLEILSEIYPHDASSRLLQSCSQAFDVSVFEIFWTWHVGACLCMATKETLFRDIEVAITALDITHLSLTPTVAALISPENVPSVNFLVTAGEAVTQKVFNAWADRGLYQGYGPSETTNICTLRPNVSKSNPINNIGCGFRNTSTFVLAPTDNFEIVPRGSEGEFCFGGAQVGRGYLNPAQNEGKFIQHDKYGRLYRSGDFGRMLPDGSLNFTGRKDDQVKIRGLRIELGEVNHSILALNEVADCITLVIDHGEGSQRLVSFWVPRDEKSSKLRFLEPSAYSDTITAIFSAITSTLPTYMVPSSLIPTSTLPQTSNYGKTDKQRLVQEYRDLKTEYLSKVSRSQSSSIHHDWTQTQSNIADAVATVAKVSRDEVGPNTSFFGLGIDSISAISLSRALRETGINAEIADILKRPSVAQLAEVVDTCVSSQKMLTTRSSDSFAFPQGFTQSLKDRFARKKQMITVIAPCTPLQEAMLSASQDPSEVAYSNHTLFDLRVTQKRLEEIWSIMVQRHEILRTFFMSTEMANFASVQIVLKSFEPQIDTVETDQLEDSIKQLKLQILDPTKETPPYRLTFINTSSGKLKLLLSMHHSLYDGYALAILYEEIEKALNNERLPPPVSFSPFLKHTISSNLEDVDRYWSKRLQNFRFLSLPPLSERPASVAPFTQRLDLTSKLSLVDFQIKTLDTSLLSMCQTVWTAILASVLQSTDICFGNIVSGRTVPVAGIERLVAPCFNTIPVRVEDVSKITFLECLRKHQSHNVDSLPHQFAPLRRIQNQASPDGVKLFETLLLLQPSSKTLNPRFWALEQDDGVMDMPMVVEITPCTIDDKLEIMLHSNSGYLSQDGACKLLDSFDKILAKALENPRHQMLTSESKRTIQQKMKERVEVVTQASPFDGFTNGSMDDTDISIRDSFSHFSGVPSEKIKPDTTIFRLGLDSINAVQIATTLRKKGHNITSSDVLQNPSIRKLAALLHSSTQAKDEKTVSFDFKSFERKHRKTVCSKLDLKSDEVQAVRPCTSVQSGMLAQSLHSDGADYVNSFIMELAPETCLQVLQSAWSAVSQSCEMLRTRFVEVDDPNHRFAMVTMNADETVLLPWFDKKAINEAIALVTNNLDFSNTVEAWPWRMDVLRNEGLVRLKFTAHHAIYDAQSLEVILARVSQSYHSGNSSLPPLPPIEPLLAAILAAGGDQHTDADRKEFWSSENQVFVNKFPDLTPLHVDSIKSFVFSRTCELSVTQLENLCSQREISVQAAGQAAWARILATYTGEIISTFGLTLSGRSITEDADSVAFPTIVTLPASLAVEGTNESLLQRSMQFSSKLHTHQFTPLTMIQKLCGHPEGKMFDTLFAYQKVSTLENDIAKPWTIIDEQASVDYAVSIELEPKVDGTLQMRLTAKESLIPRQQARLILEQFDLILQDTLYNPEKSCSATNQSGKHHLLSVTSAEHDVLPSEVALLHEFVQRQTKLTPDKIALEFVTALEPFNSTLWTYSELNAAGNKMAHLIQKQGIKQGELVAVCFDKCPEASFSILGALKAGCGYVALDPNAPADRVNFILEDSKSSLVLSAGKPFQNLIKGGVAERTRVIDVSDKEQLKDCTNTDVSLEKTIDPQDTSYCLYTSGTTGTPKGCILTHDNAVQVMLAFQRLYAGTWNEESRWLTVASWHFDVSVMEQYWSWSVGIRLICAPRDLIFEDIPGIINRLNITHIDLTPSLARLVHPDDVPSLWNGVFLTGGEQLKQEILDVWGEKCCIYNAYGPTEATIGCTMYTKVPANGKPANIGSAFPNVGTYVIKPGTNDPVFRGAVGELCVGGNLVARGYLNRDELTTERFPTFEEFGERVYRTGDLVRILHDNTFLFLGRADDQVKLRGQRIQLSEGNEVMKKYVDGLDEVVTLVLKHAKQQKEQLVTFFVPKNDQISPISFIGPMRDACKAHLPPYMVPTHIIPLKAVPLSANSKADSKQLAKRYDDYSLEELRKLGTDGQSTRTWSNKDRKVLKVLAQAICVDEEALISGTTIFELGVDSISVIGLSRSLQKSGYKNAQLSVIMQNPSIEKLVGVLASSSVVNTEQRSSNLAAKQSIAAFSHKHKASIAEELNVEALEIETLAPCTPAQEGMIYRFLDNDDDLYFNTFTFILEDGIDQQKLEQAWITITSRLQILRTKFVLTSDGCAQVVLRDKKASSSQHLLSSSEADKNEILTKPWRVEYVKHNEKTGKLAMRLTILHTLYDGMSLPILLSRLRDVYLGTKDVQYGPEFHTILPYGPLAVVEEAPKFWKKALDGLVYKQLPELSTVSTVPVHTTRHITTLTYLETLRQKLGVTYQAILQAAWSSVIQEYFTSLVSFGLVVSGRSIDFDDDSNLVIGPLLNTVVFQVAIEQDMSWKELITSCHDFNTAMLPYQHSALKDIQKWCGAGRGQTLFDALFVFQRSEEAAGDDLWRVIDTAPVADYPVAFEAQLNNDNSLTLTIVGQPEYISQEMAQSILEKIESSLRRLEDPEGRVPVIGIIAGADGHRLNLNKHSAKSTLGDHAIEFIWSKEAQTIREQIEILSETEHISENVSLFELGLDSIDVIKLSSRLKKQGINLSVSSIIRSQTIAEMTTQISSKIPIQEKPTVSIDEYEDRLIAYLKNKDQLPPGTVSVLPATPLQEGMVAEMVASDYSRYFNHEVYHIGDEVDPGKLRGAWEHVVRKHDILRTSFVEIDEIDLPFSYAQIISESSIDWSSSKRQDSDLDQTIQREITEAVQEAREGRLFRVKQLSGAYQDHFILSISHALYDGFSLQALHEDVWKAYVGLDITTPSPRRILERVLSQDGPEAVKFWKNSLSGLPTSRLQQRQNATSDVHKWESRSSQSLSSIQEFCRKNAISLQTLAQTCWALLLATYQNSLDVAFGEVLSCRESDEANQLMFPLMNTVAVRSVLHGSSVEMLRYMQENRNNMRQFEHFPLRKAQALAGPREGVLFDTLFIYQGRQGTVTEEHQVLYEAYSSLAEVEFPICVEIEIVSNQLVWRTACKDIAKSLDETKALTSDLDHVLRTIMENPQEQTIKSVKGGLSVCGLAPFQDKSVPSAQTNGHSKGSSIDSQDSPWSDTERAIRKVLSQVSQVEERDIDRDQTIFHLGLDSISAIKVTSILRRQGIKLKVQDIMQNNSIRKMATHLQTVDDVSDGVIWNGHTLLEKTLRNLDIAKPLSDAKLSDAEIEYLLPVSAGQRYMLSRWQTSGGTTFTANFEYKVSGADKNKFDNAWTALVQKHSILRTCFVQTTDPKMPFIQVVLKTKTSPIRWDANSDRYATAANTYEVDISISEPSFLAATVKKQTTILNIHLHHALYDAISLPLLMQDFEALLQNSSQSKVPPPFQDFIARGIDKDDSVLAKRREFWQGYLEPTRPETRRSSSNQRSEVFCPSMRIGNISKIAQAKGLSVDALLLSAFSKCYSSFFASKTPSSPSPKQVIGIYLSNRAEFPSLIAPTLNLLPLRIPQGSSLDESAKELQEGIQKISDSSVVSTSLAEIYEWTGVQVESFVNIWKSVDPEDDGEEKEKEEEEESRKRSGDQYGEKPVVSSALAADTFSVENSSHEAIMRTERAALVDSTPDSDIVRYSSKEMKEAYLPSIDFELKLWGDGGLDVGVFAPVELMSIEEARGFVVSLCETLLEFSV